MCANNNVCIHFKEIIESPFTVSQILIKPKACLLAHDFIKVPTMGQPESVCVIALGLENLRRFSQNKSRA